MSTYFLLLGSTPLLSLAEIKAIKPAAQLVAPSNKLVSVELENDAEAKQLMSILGGTIKILKAEKELKANDLDQIHTEMAQFLSTQQSDRPKIVFTITIYGQNQLFAFKDISLVDVKKQLKEMGIKSRFWESIANSFSVANILHHPTYIELSLVTTRDELFLARTVAIQDLDDWTKRDRQKPYANRKKGMLPPKVARMMVNMALQNSRQGVVYDPFCGSGTILMEAAQLGVSVVGSDFDANAVEGTKRNLEWLTEEYHLKTKLGVFKADVSQVNLDNLPSKVENIVTEPFLGKQTPNPKQLPGIFKGLEKLYLGAFKRWSLLLTDQARVVIVFPLVTMEKRRFSLETLIDKLVVWGYTPQIEPIIYSRPNATVQRQIFVFKFDRQIKG